MRGRVTEHQVETLFLEQQAMASRKQTPFKTKINCEPPLPWRAIRTCSHAGHRDSIAVSCFDFHSLGSERHHCSSVSTVEAELVSV